MKKVMVIGSLVVLAALVLGVAGLAYAQSQTPPTPEYPYGQGMMGGRGMMGGGGMMGRWGGQGMMGAGTYGPMHTYMVDVVAQALGLSAEEIQTRIQNGETMWEIAKSTGLSDEEVVTVMDQAHEAALDAAVAAGVITQEQADWMEQMHDRMLQNGVPGAGGCHAGQGGMMRRWNNQAPAAPQPNS